MPFHGETFRENEFEAWMNSEPKGAELSLDTDDVEALRNRVLSYARFRGHTIETEKVSERILKIKLIWI